MQLIRRMIPAMFDAIGDGARKSCGLSLALALLLAVLLSGWGDDARSASDALEAGSGSKATALTTL